MKNNKSFFLILYVLSSSILFYNCSNDNESESENAQLKGQFTDSRDNKTYKWVKLGNQIWMAENLAFKTVSKGGAYNNDENFIATYGCLYDWPTAKTVAPQGWHLPTDEEWTELLFYLKENGYSYNNGYNGYTGSNGVAKSMGSNNMWNVSNNIGSVGNSDYAEYINKSGFNALPSGIGLWEEYYRYMGEHSFWWSATISNYDMPWYYSLSFNKPDLYRGDGYHYEYAFAVRCVKN